MVSAPLLLYALVPRPKPKHLHHLNPSDMLAYKFLKARERVIVETIKLMPEFLRLIGNSNNYLSRKKST